ncbi:hypothetical protein [Thermocatellispora tengchongensis]
MDVKEVLWVVLTAGWPVLDAVLATVGLACIGYGVAVSLWRTRRR